MDRFIALYRGINVGGKNSVKMESLRAMHEQLGHRTVTSYIQSGNIVFSAAGSPAAITRKIAAQFAEEFGFAPHILVVPAARWIAIVRDNPYAKFSAKLPQTVHAGICCGEPGTKGLKALLEKTGGTETFVVKGECIYLHAPDGFGTSKFATGMEKASGVPITVRNWRTTEALWKMLVPAEAGHEPDRQ
jgi:uncharacterized protein (DUF1697 family)